MTSCAVPTAAVRAKGSWRSNVDSRICCFSPAIGYLLRDNPGIGTVDCTSRRDKLWNPLFGWLALSRSVVEERSFAMSARSIHIGAILLSGSLMMSGCSSMGGQQTAQAEGSQVG